MRCSIAFAGVCVLLAVVAFAAPANDSKAPAAFQQLKSLAGNWEGTAEFGEQKMPTKASFRVISNGSALMLTTPEGEGDDMITMFHPDGQAVLVTHYCGSGNQPRMKLAPSADPKRFAFEFLDITNVSSSDHGQMRSVIITILAPDHHIQEWHSFDHDKETVARFDMHRVKS